jgi:hypothetical protein
MRKPLWVAVGGVLAVLGLLFTLQGSGVVGGSVMSGSTFWAVAGPIIIVVGPGSMMVRVTPDLGSTVDEDYLGDMG